MRGGFLISLDHSLYSRVAAALVALGGVAARDDLEGDVVQFADGEGHLFTLYEKVPVGTEWEVFEDPITAARGVVPPDLQSVTACPFECRWPDVVARIGEVSARAAEGRTWVLDGDGVVWDAEHVDPAGVQL